MSEHKTLEKKTPQMKSAYRMKKSGNRDGGGKQRKKRTAYAKVHCDKHGVLPADGRGFRELVVGLPRTKAEKYGGCPKCEFEARIAAKSK